MSEIVGYKSGMALDRPQLVRFLPDDYRGFLEFDGTREVRVRGEELEEMVSGVLYGIGNIPHPDITPFPLRSYHRYKDTPNFQLHCDVLDLVTSWLPRASDKAKESGSKSLDPRPLLDDVEKRFGAPGAIMALELLEEFNGMMHRSTYSAYRRVKYKDPIELRELFESEDLNPSHGSYIDQRFIDFLAHNFDDIDGMHWRKFEGLTCEFFERSGYHVEIGPGRDDDNIDARVWPREEAAGEPPSIVIQCKREQKKVGKVVVKALWADLVHEQAESGLVVTTSQLSPGAAQTCVARGYPIDQANRQTLRAWLHAMRTPGTGVCMDN